MSRFSDVASEGLGIVCIFSAIIKKLDGINLLDDSFASLEFHFKLRTVSLLKTIEYGVFTPLAKPG